jgi:hypothetical protein
MMTEVSPTTANQKKRLRAAIALYVVWVGTLVTLVIVSSVKPPVNPAAAAPR